MENLEFTLEQRLSKVEQHILDLRSNQNSRRGPEGPQGHPGSASTVPGPKGDVGPAGKDADITEVIQAARDAMTAELDAVRNSLRQFIVLELENSGVIDGDGKAILIPGPAGKDGADSTVAGPSGRDGLDSTVPGPAGRDGADSQVPGPKGDKGDSIIGPAGRDGVDGRDAKIQIGTVTAGPEASVTVREENGVHVLDFVLPRGERGEIGRDGLDSTVAGPPGKDGEDSIVPGPEGPRGLPATLDKAAVARIILELKQRGSL